MKNVTITLPDDVARTARVEAAKAGLSMSAWFRRLAEQAARSGSRKSDPAEDAAWDRLLNGPAYDLGLQEKAPARDERNARR